MTKNLTKFYEGLSDQSKLPTDQWDIPTEVYIYAYKEFEEFMSGLYYPTLMILPLTPEGEDYLEYISDYQFNDKRELVNQSIYRYGAYVITIDYEGEKYNVVIINND